MLKNLTRFITVPQSGTLFSNVRGRRVKTYNKKRSEKRCLSYLEGVFDGSNQSDVVLDQLGQEVEIGRSLKTKDIR
jgi:hypothetical protein